MRRIQPLRYEQLTEKQRAVWDRVVSDRGASMVTSDGTLNGPLDIWLHAPGVGAAMSALGDAVGAAALDRRSKELAVITVVAHWKNEFVWHYHAGFARDAGVSRAAIDAIGAGAEPALTTDRDRAAYAAARELVTTGATTDETVYSCKRLFGERATVELVTTSGYYSALSFLVDLVDIPLPPEAVPRWSAVEVVES